ncbi:putative nuclease HARBI1-like [Triplophysa rosa]|uniref:Nuclease HARBI1-like n=1 Tax=Triplophysa rosa TaxID=992332 RepID=A0A9W7W819_TRIRA|nr:putative nuclease HARBI1-like [Triplophysa rosa]
MSCLFLREQPILEGVRIIRRAFRINRVLRDRQDPLAQRDSILLERYHFSREGIIYLVNLLDPYVKNLTLRTMKSLTTAQTVYIALRFFASVKSAVCRAIRKVYMALNQFLGVFVAFFAIAGFPNVIGAIDCTHTLPSRPPPRWYVTMCHITNVEAKWPGSVHDSRIFRETRLCTFFEPVFYDPNPGSQTCYNSALARTRACIDMTFGQLKGRFQCLKNLRVAPDRACNIMVACAVLHNIATIRKARTPVVEVQPPDDLQPVHLDQPSGRAARDRIVQQHF